MISMADIRQYLAEAHLYSTAYGPLTQMDRVGESVLVERRWPDTDKEFDSLMFVRRGRTGKLESACLAVSAQRGEKLEVIRVSVKKDEVLEEDVLCVFYVRETVKGRKCDEAEYYLG